MLFGIYKCVSYIQSIILKNNSLFHYFISLIVVWIRLNRRLTARVHHFIFIHITHNFQLTWRHNFTMIDQTALENASQRNLSSLGENYLNLKIYVIEIQIE